MNVAGLSAHSNIDKAHEVANDCKRLNKALKECQELASMYNNRERLFGMPITNVTVFLWAQYYKIFIFNFIIPIKYEKLTRLVKDFEPYRNLWVTCSDWLRWYDMWMNDPMSSIDAENIERNVSDAYKSMHKAIKQFAEFESNFYIFNVNHFKWCFS